MICFLDFGTNHLLSPCTWGQTICCVSPYFGENYFFCRLVNIICWCAPYLGGDLSVSVFNTQRHRTMFPFVHGGISWFFTLCMPWEFMFLACPHTWWQLHLSFFKEMDARLSMAGFVSTVFNSHIFCFIEHIWLWCYDRFRTHAYFVFEHYIFKAYGFNMFTYHKERQMNNVFVRKFWTQLIFDALLY